MYYYFDKSTHKCAHMSSGRLVAGQYQEIVDDKSYPVLEALHYVETDGVCLIVEDSDAVVAVELDAAKMAPLAHAEKEIVRWGDVGEFAQGDEQQAALDMAKIWREYRYKVTIAKSLPLPPTPEEQSDE